MVKFNNIPNKSYNTEDGIIWHSRSIAVVPHIYCLCNSYIYVLIGKRGSKCDNFGLWNLPCGYLDWNEDLKGAIIREVYEETGVNLHKYTKTFGKSNLNNPFIVNTSPNNNLQNIALHCVYGFIANELPILTTLNAELNEVEDVMWLKIGEELRLDVFSALDYRIINKLEFAYNHKDVIENSYYVLTQVLYKNT